MEVDELVKLTVEIHYVLFVLCGTKIDILTEKLTFNQL